MKNEYELASKIADGVNSLVFNKKDFCEAMDREHRTLQENFTSLAIAWLRHVGEDNYKYDERNRWSHIIGKVVKDKLDSLNL